MNNDKPLWFLPYPITKGTAWLFTIGFVMSCIVALLIGSLAVATNSVPLLFIAAFYAIGFFVAVWLLYLLIGSHHAKREATRGASS
jgi:hypothetical protein